MMAVTPVLGPIKAFEDLGRTSSRTVCCHGRLALAGNYHLEMLQFAELLWTVEEAGDNQLGGCCGLESVGVHGFKVFLNCNLSVRLAN